MELTYDSQFFAEFLNGRASEMKPMVNLLAQVFAILIGGIVLWRISTIFGKKKKTRKQSMFMDSQFQSWRSKR